MKINVTGQVERSGQTPIKGIDRHAIGIEAVNVASGYRSGPSVLTNLSFKLCPGEIVCIVGPSGCGKSTLLRVIAGLIRVNAGELRYQGCGSSLSPGDVGFVFQEATLLPWRTTEENVRLPLEMLRQEATIADWKPASDMDRVRELLRTVQLDANAWQKYPRELSGGMKMRVSLARALVTNPRLMLLDEPFAALDELLRSQLNQLMLQLWEMQNSTMVFVTHNISEALMLSHRVFCMSGGRIVNVIDNTLDWPRNESIRMLPDFTRLYREISASIVPRSLEAVL